jgi:predicted nuclease with RNAse H fold
LNSPRKQSRKHVGIDLAGVERRDTGFCILNEKLHVEVSVMHQDSEILDAVFAANPVTVAIDAPLSLPMGRKSLAVRSSIHLRQCDRELLRMRIPFFPVTLGPMRKLTARGIKLNRILGERRFNVIEVYPGAAQDLWGIPRKQKGLLELRKGLEQLGIELPGRPLTGDELDAVTAAMVAKQYYHHDYLAVGLKSEGQIILPRNPHFKRSDDGRTATL